MVITREREKDDGAHDTEAHAAGEGRDAAAEGASQVEGSWLMAPTFNDMPVKRVYVDAAVRFEAYVLDHGDDTDHEVEAALAGRIACEIADAVEHHAPYLSDSEDTDALVALVGGGSGRAANVIVGYRVVDNHDDTDADVRDAVEGTEAWKG